MGDRTLNILNVNHCDENENNTNNSLLLNEEQLLQYKIQKCQLELYRQCSMKSTKHVKKNDFHLKINRLLVKKKFILIFYFSNFFPTQNSILSNFIRSHLMAL